MPPLLCITEEARQERHQRQKVLEEGRFTQGRNSPFSRLPATNACLPSASVASAFEEVIVLQASWGWSQAGVLWTVRSEDTLTLYCSINQLTVHIYFIIGRFSLWVGGVVIGGRRL